MAANAALLTRMRRAGGGQAGQRLLAHLPAAVSGSTLLGRSGGWFFPRIPPVEVVGVDEFAFRRGRRFGAGPGGAAADHLRPLPRSRPPGSRSGVRRSAAARPALPAHHRVESAAVGIRTWADGRAPGRGDAFQRTVLGGAAASDPGQPGSSYRAGASGGSGAAVLEPGADGGVSAAQPHRVRGCVGGRLRGPAGHRNAPRGGAGPALARGPPSGEGSAGALEPDRRGQQPPPPRYPKTRASRNWVSLSLRVVQALGRRAEAAREALGPQAPLGGWCSAVPTGHRCDPSRCW